MPGALTGMVSGSHSGFERTPVDAQSKTNQWMAHVDQLFQVNLEQLPLWLLWFLLGSHIFPQKTSSIPVPSGKF
jgi:hypothetical protein